MYKKQMVFQRIICMAVLVVSALVFIYSLGLMTDLYDSLVASPTIRDPRNLDGTTVAGARIYYDMQGFNRSLTKVGIGLILVSLVLFVMNTHSRRKYYIGNYFAVGLSAVCNIAAAVWGIMQTSVWRAQFLQIDFEALKKHSERWKSLYTDSTFWFDAGYVIFSLLIVVTVLLVCNVMMKIRVMKEEKRMIGSRKEVEA